ncbi:MAG: hypothetical protein WD469_06115, partial [Paenibacillaceae bacterium]
MQGMVMKVTENRIVVLCEDGRFRNMPLSSEVPALGEGITVPEASLNVHNLNIHKNKGRFSLNKTWIAAALFVLLIGVMGLLSVLNVFNRPTAVVAIDINPSVELFVDSKGKVRTASLLNEDARWMITEQELVGKDMYDAINKIISKAEAQGFLDPSTEKKLVMMAVVNLSKTSLQVDLQKLSALNKEYKVELRYSNKKQKEKAEQMGLTLNKFIVYEQGKQMGIQLNVDELRKHSIIYTLTRVGWDPESFFKKEAKPFSPDKMNKDRDVKTNGDGLNNEDQGRETELKEKTDEKVENNNVADEKVENNNVADEKVENN